MKASGCRGVFAGLESVDDRVLQYMNKHAKADDYRRGLAQLKKHDINVHANFIVGFPGETEESAHKIVPFVNDLGIDFCTVVCWIYIPSTPISARAEELGIRGHWVDWQHNTMSSEQAQLLARQVVEKTSAVHNAVRGEAWMEFMLYANGFTLDEAKLAVRTFNQFLGRDVPAAEIQATPEFRALQGVLESHPMPRP
jgi:p-methyltransferase